MSRLQNRRIFYLEDNLYNRSIVQTLIERDSGKLFFERWGKDTVARIVQNLPIDLILLDLHVPQSSGYEVYQEIAKHPDLGNIPVVVVTAADPGVEMPKARKLGMAGFISKPIISQLFVQQIVSVIEGNEIWASA